MGGASSFQAVMTINVYILSLAAWCCFPPLDVRFSRISTGTQAALLVIVHGCPALFADTISAMYFQDCGFLPRPLGFSFLSYRYGSCLPPCALVLTVQLSLSRCCCRHISKVMRSSSYIPSLPDFASVSAPSTLFILLQLVSISGVGPM